MKQTWQLEEVNQRFHEVMEEAIQQGPQVIASRGEEVAVVVSIDEYRRLVEQGTSLVEFFRNSSLVGTGLDLSRDQSLPRDSFNS
jgi:prevent-host-death family protein